MTEELSTPEEGEHISPDEERPALPQEEAREALASEDIPADELPVPLDDEPEEAE